ncbi:DUF4876 domain-containing protein [Capnocytophaga sp. HP1101]
MKYLKQLLVLALGLVLLNACKKDDEPNNLQQTYNVTLQLQLPEGVTITGGNVNVTATELNRKEKTERTFTDLSKKEVLLQLPAGSYEVSAKGQVTYTFKGESKQDQVALFINKIDVTAPVTQAAPLTFKVFRDDFVIEEIFFTGNLTPQGKQYNGDKYFKIYNNTDRVLYADGLIIAESQFTTPNKQEYTPDIMKEAFTAIGIIQIPGNGTQYPVQPGASIVIADQGINHKESNPNAIDLSKADFEIGSGLSYRVDSPSVPNVINLYDNIIFDNQGRRSYVIARLPQGITKDNFLNDYKYEFSWNTGVSVKTNSAYKIPNEWIIDAVNSSVKSTFQWIITDPSIDAGYTYIATVASDKTRYGKSVRRKVLSENNGKTIFKDTNNSTDDFEITSPTLKK